MVIAKGRTGSSAYVPDSPGCVAAAEQRAEVLALIRAIEVHIEGLRQPNHRVARIVGRMRSMMLQASAPGTDGFSEVAAYQMTPVGIGKSASSVFRLTYPGKPALYLKTAGAPYVAELESEHERLIWLKGRAPVPEVVDFKSSAEQAALLTQALPGVNAIEVPKRHRAAVIRGLAQALRELHSIAIAGCPFDSSLAVSINSARARAMANLIDESNFDEEHKGLRARDLLTQLEQQRPADESLVITHGDACLPNMIFEGRHFCGFVDCGRSGLADAYQDLAVASRSIASNYGQEYVDRFFDAYGLREVDDGKLSYYRLADEFF